MTHPSDTGPAPSALVSVRRCGSYEPEPLAAALVAALAPLGGMRAFVPPGAKVLVKPNLLKGAGPDAAVTTHPELVRAVVRAVREAGAGGVLVGDSPGGPQSERLLTSFATQAGIAQVCAEEGVDLVAFDATSRAEVPPADAEGRGGHSRYRSFELASQAVEADVLVNLPKLKTHGFMMMTGAVKNLFGLVPGLAKARFHLTVPERDAFAEMLVDLALARPATLTVMDAVVAMEGQGPAGGTPRSIGGLMASADPFALDVLAAAVCGFDAGEVYTNVAARARGLAPERPDDIPVAGDDWRGLVAHGFSKPPRDLRGLFPGWAVGPLREASAPRPRLESPDLCTGCAVCARSCPVDAIEMSGTGSGAKRPRFDYDACIRCYCCHEMCPPQALKLRGPWFLRRIARREQGRA